MSMTSKERKAHCKVFVYGLTFIPESSVELGCKHLMSG